MRRAGARPAGREPVIDVFPNSNEGDQSAGLDGQGPLIAERVGARRGQGDVQGVEARRQAPERRRRRSTCAGPASASAARPPPTARSPTTPQAGAPFLTGSEEGRGPLYDITHQPLEGDRSPDRERAEPGRTRSGSRSRRPRTATPAPCRSSSCGSAKRIDHHLPRRGDGRGRPPRPRPGPRRSLTPSASRA